MDSIRAFLGLDTAGFRAGLGSAESALSRFAGKLGIGLSVVGLEHITKGIIDYGARIYDLGQRYDVSTESIQRFGNAAEKNGSSLEGIAKGFNKLEISQSRALGGNEKILSAFDNLGISVEDLKKLSPDQIMLKLGKSSLNAADLVALLGKSALELRPTLRGLADGTIELGDAIEDPMIKQLKEADKTLTSFHEKLRVFGASVITNVAAGWQSRLVNPMLSGISDIKFAWQSLQDLIHGRKSFGEIGEEAHRRAAAAARELTGQTTPEEKKDNKPKFAPEGEGEKAKSKADLAAERKERERIQFSLKELAEEGARAGISHGRTILGWKGEQATGTIQAIYAAQQAREVQALEAQARQVGLTGISPTGESARNLLDRADQIRQSIGGLKESDKDVGAFKQALGGVEQKIDTTNSILQQDE